MTRIITISSSSISFIINGIISMGLELEWVCIGDSYSFF